MGRNRRLQRKQKLKKTLQVDYRDFIWADCKGTEGARAQGRSEISFSEFSNSRSGRKVAPTSGANPLKETPLSHLRISKIFKNKVHDC